MVPGRASWAQVVCLPPILTRAVKGRLSLALLAVVAGLVAPPVLAADGVAPPAGVSHHAMAQEHFSVLPAAEAPPTERPHSPERANFGQEHPSLQARQVADWIVDSGDNHGMPFVIVDKVDAQVFVLDPKGQLRGTAPALLGLAKGDDSVPGIGQRKLSTIRPEERTTPAGRFVASLDRDLHGEEILWVDYDAGIALHRVVTSNPRERRQQRLDSPSPLDNRISYGCINVPAKFYDTVVSPAFTGTNGVVYILPETRSAQEVFSPDGVESIAGPKPLGQVGRGAALPLVGALPPVDSTRHSEARSTR